MYACYIFEEGVDKKFLLLFCVFFFSFLGGVCGVGKISFISKIFGDLNQNLCEVLP
jgi:putative ribosome biogenesis GTPase RsgA